jgi:hypothetical protein
MAERLLIFILEKYLNDLARREKMKNAIRLWIVVTACLLMSGTVWADNAEYRLVLARNDMSIGGEFHVDLQIRATSGTALHTLASSTVDIYYTQYADDPSTNWAFTWLDGYSIVVDKLSGYYRLLITAPNVNTANLATPPGNPDGWDVTYSWQRIATFRWTINSLTSTQVTINDASDAAGYFDNWTNAPKGGMTGFVVTNQDLGDVSLPVQMTNLSAQATSREGVILNWTTESETNSAGFHVWRGESENAINLRVTSVLIPNHGNSSSRNEYTFTDRDAHGETFWYKIEEVSLDGQSQFIGPITVEAAMPLPEQFSVSRNYPNPFNPETTIHYELPEDASVSVRVFDLMGREVKTLTDVQMSAGRYDAKWDGTNQFGNAVSSGMYFIRVQAGEFSAVRKMTLMR